MCLAQGPQRSDAGEARTRGPSVSIKMDFEKNQQMTKKHEKFPRGQRVK